MLKLFPISVRCLSLTLFFVAVSNIVLAEQLGNATLDVNAATEQQLSDLLPGIGPAKAARIVKWRDLNGPFNTLEELIEVHGIGPKTLQGIRALLHVGDAASTRQHSQAAQRYENQVRLAVKKIVDRANRDAARERMSKSP
ncbi:MAG: ComEA family DNA-binding protein [Granulosicoccus sp.]